MRKGQRIRLSASARAARDWGVSVGAVGTVLCLYRTTTRLNEKNCVDVSFGAGMIVWGAPVSAFEVIADNAQGR
jgi:hypothetical protein